MEPEPSALKQADGSTHSAVLAPRRRDLPRLAAETRAPAAVSFLLGSAGLALTTVGLVCLFAVRGVSNYTLVAATLTSTQFRVIEVVAASLGLGAILLGAGFYRRMDTRTARSEAVIGLVLGLQAAALAIGLALFATGDMETFAQNFLDFSNVTPLFGDFVLGMKNTVILASVSTAGAIGIGLVVALFAISPRAVVRAPARVYVNLVRGTPILLLLAVIYFGLSLGLSINLTPFRAVMVGLAIHAGAYVAEIFRAGLESLERGQLDAARGLGLTYMKSMKLVIVPQAFRRVIPPLMNTYIGLVKDTSLIAFLGVTLEERELFSVASQGYAQYFNATFYVASALGYLAVTLPLIALVNYLEKRLRSGLVAIGAG